MDADERAGDLVVALEDAVVERGGFRLGPFDLDLVPAERLAVTGRNGSGKTTLLLALLGELPLVSGRRRVGPRTRLGVLAQDRGAFANQETLLAAFAGRTGLSLERSRTLLAKFGLGADARRPTVRDALSRGADARPARASCSRGR